MNQKPQSSYKNVNIITVYSRNLGTVADNKSFNKNSKLILVKVKMF